MTYPHAYSGDRRVPLTEADMQPFRGTPVQRRPYYIAPKPDRSAAVKRVRQQVSEAMGIPYADTFGTSHEPHKVDARAECAWRLTQETDMTRTDISKALGMKVSGSVKRLLERRAERRE